MFQGDSGGSVLYKDGYQFTLIGVIQGVLEQKENEIVKGNIQKEKMKVQVQFFNKIFRNWIESKMVNPEYCISGPDAGNITFTDVNEEDVEENYDKRATSIFWNWVSLNMIASILNIITALLNAALTCINFGIDIFENDQDAYGMRFVVGIIWLLFEHFGR